jgi:hypothetical protein
MCFLTLIYIIVKLGAGSALNIKSSRFPGAFNGLVIGNGFFSDLNNLLL